MEDIGDSMAFEDFLEWSVCQLQFYLMKRGKSTTGNKKDLAARALVVFESNDPIVDCPKDISQQLEREYNRLLSKCNIEDPRKLNDEVWQNDLTTWPATNLGHIFQYVLISKAFETDYIGQYKARKAYSYFKSGHVHQILTYRPKDSSDTVVLKSSVTPSMKVNDKPREVWILISKSTGTIISAYCVCTAGFSKCCNHVVAVLYKLQFAVERGFTQPSCTEVPCAFNDKTNYKVVPKKLKDMEITKHDAFKQTTKRSLFSSEKYSFDPRNPCSRQQSAEAVLSFFNKLEEVQPKAVVLLTVPPSESSECPPPITEIAEEVKSQCKDDSEAKLLESFMSKLTFSDKQLDELEKATKDQAKSDMWRKQRIGRITASNFHEVHSKVKSISSSRGAVKPQTTPLLIKLTRPENLDHVAAIKWGRENEHNARQAFFSETSPQHQNPKLCICGLRAVATAPFLAASADNLFNCSCCGKFCVELKCPFSIRKKAVQEGFKDLDYLEEINGQIKLKTTHKYYTQVQGQMAAYNCSKAFFVVWTPVGSPHIELIKFEVRFWDEVYRNLILFFKLYLSKVLLGLHELLFCPTCESRILEAKEFSQRQASQENSICCDACYQWYHWPCAGITEGGATASTWICKLCTAD